MTFTKAAPRRMPMTLDQWIDATVANTEDPYRYLDRDLDDRDAVDALLGRRG